jgi:hypothetical protein
MASEASLTLSPASGPPSSMRARRPGPPPHFYDRPGVLPPPGDLALIALRRPPRRDLHGPADPVQQHIHPRPALLHPEPPPDLVRDPGQGQALIQIARGRRADVQQPPPVRRPAPR